MATKTGGRRAGAGRPKGSRNKEPRAKAATADEIGQGRQVAQKWAPAALKALAIMAALEPPDPDLPHLPVANETVKHRCLDTLIDRAYGKPSQPMEHSVDEGLEAVLERIGRRAVLKKQGGDD